MERKVLGLDRVHSSVQSAYTGFHAGVLQQVIDAVDSQPVVIVGMKTNTHVKGARKALDQAGVNYTYLEFGGYTSMWKPRLAIKMWSGWPTFPQVFVHGRLIGGESDLKKLIEAGQLQPLLNAGRAG